MTPTDLPMTVLLVAGARPNFMKIAPVLRVIEEAGHRSIIVHTGQHYDDRMSDAFFEDLEIRPPDFHLEVGSASHAVQTARIMERFEPVLLETRPDWVLVPGDVNSTVACALVSVKLKAETGSKLAHLEAGLRSHDWRMPEEINRVLTDRCADLLLIPSRDAVVNLEDEGIPAERVAFVGNVMIDTLLKRLQSARALDAAGQRGLERGRFALATLHRPSNVDTEESLVVCLEALSAVGRERPLVLPVHPRTQKQIVAFGLEDLLAPLVTSGPLPYIEMLSLIDAAEGVLTDSGGIQEETTALGVPCVTLREQTERPITIEKGTNALAPWPLSVEGVTTSYEQQVGQGRAGVGERAPEGWDGLAGQRTVEALVSYRGE